jgi:hypothetical protein
MTHNVSTLWLAAWFADFVGHDAEDRPSKLTLRREI